MNTLTISKELVLTPEDNNRLFRLCGQFNEHVKMIEKRLGVFIKQRGHAFSISGERKAVTKACNTLEALYEETKKIPLLEAKDVHLYLQALADDTEEGKATHHEGGGHRHRKRHKRHQHQHDPHDQHDPHENVAFMREPMQRDPVQFTTKKGIIVARGANQVSYLQSIEKNDINFGIGPAGTGKTYLAVASAVFALESERVSRLVLVRPIVEAGEKLGFLPGDIAEKVHPYLRPLYDALYEMMGADKVNHLIERDIIELLPLAYMRGRSLNDSFIILDEAQNTTIEQMKMFLTRIGFHSKAVVTGDTTQIDLPNRRDSGLIHAEEVLKNVSGISFSRFKPHDVVRHPLVQRIVEAYEQYDETHANKNKPL